MRLIATKTRRYGTRALRAGDAFDVDRTQGRVLIAIGHARIDDGNPVQAPAPTPVNTLDAARARYQNIVGKKPFHGWDVLTLGQKVAEYQAKG